MIKLTRSVMAAPAAACMFAGATANPAIAQDKAKAARAATIQQQNLPRLSFNAHAACARHLFPFRHFGGEMRGELFGRAADRITAILREALPEVRLGQRPYDFGIESVNDSPGGAARRGGCGRRRPC